MKTFVFVFALIMAISVAAFADDSAQPKRRKAKPAKAQTADKKAVQAPEKKERTTLTGSFISRDVHQSGLITDGPNAVYVLDQHTIRTSGAGDLSQVLINRGFRR